MRSVIIGADGGGTKTNLVAVDALSGQKIAASSAGSIHIYSMGIKMAVDNMETAIRNCISQIMTKSWHYPSGILRWMTAETNQGKTFVNS